MHYYQHNIGDYRKDTSHLSLLEHGIYRQLLDSYYLDEIPLSNDLAKLMRSHSVRTAEEQQSLQNVLTDFFELTEFGYIHKRCEDGIAKFHGKSASARASAMARWSSKHKEVDANAIPTQSEGNANHKPITNNHKPIKNIQPVGFDLFWDAYDKKVGKPNALKEWSKAKIDENLLKVVVDQAKKCAQSVEKQFRKDPERWIKYKGWEDEIILIAPKASEMPLGTEQQIEEAYRVECGGDPRMARFGSYFDMKKFILDQRDKKKRVA